MSALTNRELASAIWLAVLVLSYLLLAPAFRSSVRDLLKAFFAPWAIGTVGLMALYMMVVVWMLAGLGFWTPKLLKDTVLWFCVGALPLAVAGITTDLRDGLARRVLAHSLRAVVVLEFIVSKFTFSLPVEMLLVPTLCWIAVMGARSAIEPGRKTSADLARILGGLAGLAIVATAIWQALAHGHKLASADTLSELLLPPLLSLSLTPFIYLLVLQEKYRILLQRLDWDLGERGYLRWYARRRSLAHVGFSVRRVKRLLGGPDLDLTGAHSKEDVDRVLEAATRRPARS